MQIAKRIKELKEGLDYLEQYDQFRESPDRRKIISITLSNKILQRMSHIKNKSRFIETAIENSLLKESRPA